MTEYKSFKNVYACPVDIEEYKKILMSERCQGRKEYETFRDMVKLYKQSKSGGAA